MRLNRASVRFVGVAAVSAAVVLLAGMLTRLPAAEPPGGTGVAQPAQQCTVRELTRRRLGVGDGLELYVEPVAFVASGKRVLLAGTPNYLYTRRADGSVLRQVRDSVFGVVIDADLRAHTIPSPIPARLVSGVRASAREDGAWDVVFAQEEPWNRFPPPDSSRVVWYGKYDGREWSSLTRLPVPPGAVFHPFLGSPLVRRGDTLAWAMSMTGSDGRRGTVLFERKDGNWRSERLPTGGADYVAPMYSDSAGLLLAVIQPDRALRSDAQSLILYGRRPEWRPLRRVVRGRDEPVGRPIYDPTPGGRAFGWTNTLSSSAGLTERARAFTHSVEDSLARVIDLDHGVIELAVVPMPDGSHIWVSASTSPEGGPQLRFLRQGADSARSIGSLPYPFLGGFGAASIRNGDLLIGGPVVDPVTRSTPVSLLLHLHLTCA